MIVLEKREEKMVKTSDDSVEKEDENLGCL
jgi:hypothetical protein